MAECVDSEGRDARLWELLDNIDTLSDSIKPADLDGFKLFYERALAFCEKRNAILESDGYRLYLPGEAPKPDPRHKPFGAGQ